MMHDGSERKRSKKIDNQNPSPETTKEATRNGFKLHMIATNNWSSPAPPIDNNKRLGHLSRADWPAGNEDRLLGEDDEPQVDGLDPVAQGCRTDLPTDLSEQSTVAKSIPLYVLITEKSVFHRFCTHIMMYTLR